MSLKPMPPENNNPAERERYRRDMAAYYADPGKWGWTSGPKPEPGKCEKCKGNTYPEHGVLQHLGDGTPAGNKCKASPAPKG